MRAADERKQALAAALPPVVPTDAHLKGMWGPVYDWPLIPIHAVLMPDGRVMTYGSTADGASTAFFSVDVWDNAGNPDTGHLSFPNGTGTDFFCSSQLLLPPASNPNGTNAPNVFIAGGDIWTGTGNSFIGNNRSTLFDAGSNTVLRGNDMASPRWYATSTTLVNGETYIQGGSGGAAFPEVRQLDGTFRQLTSADTSFLLWSYPRNYVMPDGAVFGYDFEGRMYFVRTEGAGRLDAKAILPLQYFGAGSSAMFRPGRILQIAGNTNAAAVIDVTSGNPVFTPTQSISTVRKLMTATLLADGKVVVTGGSPVWNELLGANKNAEIWNPVSGQWTPGAEGDRARLYHSSALMLPDATVLVGGGGASAPIGADPAGERNVQIYYPPYLFTAGGVRAPRPAIASTPDWLEIGKTFTVQTSGSNGVSRVTLVKTGSVTHGYNLDQRFLELPFTATAINGGHAVTVNSPARPGEATPGYYMLFVFDALGVPSEAKILRMGVAGPINAALSPRLSNPGDITSLVNEPQSRNLVASDPNGDTLTFSAAGLPPGVVLDSSSGRLSGAPTAAGSFDVVLSVSDGTHSAGASLVWTVTAPTPLTLTLPPAPGASLSGGTALFAAGAAGVGVQYAWDFGDGSPVTAWSSQGTVGKAYTAPGTYVVTLRVRDSTGAQISRSFLQTVYLGNGDKPSRASSNLVIETPLLGTDRLWVVNPDNNSITGFDTYTNARLGEVAVGNNPRSVAVDAKGLLWVTNQDDASISIIDPATRTVQRTLALPRASQPFGVVTSPLSPTAFVVLQATGELLRFDSNSFTETGRVALGAGVRQVSVLGNGQSIYVSRFITAPLPGESTAAVATPNELGGEVIEVNAAAMTVNRNIVLTHSNRADAENQGSGIPNYLGAVAISPDGSQAYVPSKQDNVLRGVLRNNTALNFQNTVRAVSSRIVIKGVGAGSEDLARRVDHDNASVATAATYDRRGVLMFVALETSREVAVVDAHTGAQITRFNVGRAPQGLVLSADGYTLYVNNFMDRTVSVHNLRPLLDEGLAVITSLATLQAVQTDRLAANVLLGKQLFYDAKDPRLARDSYLSCASCHADGGHDGRVWDFTQMGEGLRNTTSLRGRAGAQGRLHWSGNFDEVQDFEGQIRSLGGGSGLMGDADFTTGTRSSPLGDRKAGIAADLDALAAYVSSLNTAAQSPARASNGELTPAGAAGKLVFAAQCASCHAGANFSDSNKQVLRDIGTQNAASGQRLGQTLNGIDVPSLREAWATAPYLHNGAASTLQAAVLAHGGLNLSAQELADVVSYTQQIGAEELEAPASSANLVVRAFSTLLDRVGALIEVRVNNNTVGRAQLDAGGLVELFFDVATLVKDTIVEVVFRNNADNAVEDRNLVVQSIQLNGSTTVAASAPGVLIDKGADAAAFDNVDTVTAAATGGWMPWDSAMRFKVPSLGNGDSVTVRARATLAAGVGAQMELRINGVLVGSRLVSATTVQDFVFTTPPIAAGDRIDVLFTNDANIDGEDRNLFVESVTARGTVLPATSPEATIDQGSGARAFDGLSVVPAASYGGWIPWNAALRLVAR